jgi:hypothetical protein
VTCDSNEERRRCASQREALTERARHACAQTSSPTHLHSHRSMVMPYALNWPPPPLPSALSGKSVSAGFWINVALHIWSLLTGWAGNTNKVRTHLRSSAEVHCRRAALCTFVEQLTTDTNTTAERMAPQQALTRLSSAPVAAVCAACHCCMHVGRVHEDAAGDHGPLRAHADRHTPMDQLEARVGAMHAGRFAMAVWRVELVDGRRLFVCCGQVVLIAIGRRTAAAAAVRSGTEEGRQPVSG